MSEQFDLAEFRKERDEQRKATGRFTPTVVDLLAAYESGERNLRAANLRAANLRAANLSAADLRAADLSDANLRAANLYAANLSAANLSAANLSAADLSAADLSDADLSDADLSAAIGIYYAFGLGMSILQIPLYGGVEIINGKVELFLVAGCQRGNPTFIRETLTKDHGVKVNLEQCEAAIECIEKLFASDMKQGKWNYLLELE